MLESLSAAELGEVLAFAAAEPFGEEREDFRAAQAAFVTAMASGAKGARLEHFLPRWGRAQDEPQEPSDIDRNLQALEGRLRAGSAKE